MLSAVSCTTADHSRLGEVIRSKAASSSLMTPSGEAAASSVSCSRGVFDAARHNGRAASANTSFPSIVKNDEERVRLIEFYAFPQSGATDRKLATTCQDRHGSPDAFVLEESGEREWLLIDSIHAPCKTLLTISNDLATDIHDACSPS